MTMILLLCTLVLPVVTADEMTCDLDVTLLNQDPYPAIPGEYVKLVFQVEGLESPDCSDITFKLTENYPIKFNPGETGLRTFKKVDYIKDYTSNLLIPYEVRIDDAALDGSSEIETRVQSKNTAPLITTLNIEVDDSRADFEVHVKDYSYITKELTLEILNIEESDAEALVVEIPKQENIIIKGSNRVIVGDVDSNEYTTADFEATPSNGEITLELTYSDSINARRTVEETITFDSTYFTERAADQKTTGKGTYIFWAVVIILLVWWGYSKFSKKKKK
ncbi:hypothetical protein HN903_04355 [archaeon]|nr:hypothetical protein [archaeon]MBT7128959.1 hypothetical protein [archaeon]